MLNWNEIEKKTAYPKLQEKVLPKAQPVVKKPLTPSDFRNSTGQTTISAEQQAKNQALALQELQGKDGNIASFVRGAAGMTLDPYGVRNQWRNEEQEKASAKNDYSFNAIKNPRMVAQGLKPVETVNVKGTYEGLGELAGSFIGVDPVAIGVTKGIQKGVQVTKGLNAVEKIPVLVNGKVSFVDAPTLPRANESRVLPVVAKNVPVENVKAQPDTLPKSSTVTVQPRNTEKGAEIPKEQPFVKNVDLPKTEVKAKNIAESFPNENMQSVTPDAEKTRGFSKNVSTDKFMNENLQKSFVDTPETYTQLSNVDTLKRADNIFLSTGAKESYDTVMKAIASNTLRPEHVPLARKVANQLAKEGDVESARRILSDIAVKQTESGQFSQAAAILRNSDPMAVMQFIEKTVNKTNEELKKRIKGFDGLRLTDEEVKRLADIDMGDEEAIKQAVSDIGKRLAKEIPSTWFEKFDELRRIAMLGNFKTQGRNLVGNVPLMLERKISNKVSAVVQKALPKDQRTQALFIGRDSKNLAKQLYQNDKDWLLDSNKWDTNDLRKILSEERQVFKQSLVGKGTQALGLTGKAQTVADSIGLEGFRKLVYGSLQLGDTPFLKSAYTDRMASYISAQGYKSLDEVPQKALDTAREEALKATFRDANNFAKAINDVKRKGGFLGKVTEATLPFVTTPTNLVRRTIDYSPAGLIRSFAKMKKAEDIPKIIDEMAQGLTGTGLILLGAYYAKNGVLIGAADENKNKANYEKATGKQPFSVQTPLGTVTYDWAQPFGSQLAVAAEMYKAYNKAMKETGKFTFTDFTNAALQSGYAGIDVILQSSVYQNILDLFSGYGSAGERIIQNVSEYPLQIIPTLSGQTARANDPYIRNSFDKTSKFASYENTIKAKLPIAAESLPIKYDVWGRPVKRVENAIGRAAQEFLNPANVLAKNETPFDKEILSLYQKTGSNDVFPRTAPYSFDNGKYELNNKDVSEYQRVMGQYSQKEVNKLFHSPEYKTMSDDDKLKALNEIYVDASKEAKYNYFDNKGLPVTLALDKTYQEKYNTVKGIVNDKQFYKAVKNMQSAGSKDVEKAYAVDSEFPNAPAKLYDTLGISVESVDKAKALRQSGIAVTEYQTAYEKANINDSGNVSKAEAIAYLEATNYPQSKKFIMMKALVPTLKDQNNPYR